MASRAIDGDRGTVSKMAKHMADRSHPLVDLLQRDQRYSLDAYQFVRDALTYAQVVLRLGRRGGGLDDEATVEFDADDSSAAPEDLPHFQPIDELVDELVEEGEEDLEGEEPGRDEKHVTGQQLCVAIRQYALDQYGYMARSVLGSWGIHETGDFGEIVYNLIGIGLMKKSEGDRREDFNDVYDFDEALLRSYEITLPD
jgi:uncharacterized repeat protein (TIGR04138 family)